MGLDRIMVDGWVYLWVFACVCGGLGMCIEILGGCFLFIYRGLNSKMLLIRGDI